MQDAQGNLNALPPFLFKTYEMVDDQTTDTVVSWSSTNKSFIVWVPAIFSRDLLPKFFKHSNFSSFIRQLNTYGFRKIDPEQWEFANDDFIRGQPQLLKNIHRRKPVHSHSMQNLHGQGNPNPLAESEKQGYMEKINTLRHEKETFLEELQSQAKEQRQIETAFLLLRDQLQHMEQSQSQIHSTLSEKLQKPEFMLNLVQGIRAQADRGTRHPRSDAIVASSVFRFDIDLLGQLESSVCFWENILSDMSELIAHGHTPMNLTESTCSGSPVISMSYTQVNVDLLTANSSDIDVNCEPSLSPASVPSADTATSVTQGVNDVFWEQFLTQNPGLSEAKGGELERKELDDNGKGWENNSTDYGKYWWNRTSGKSLQEHIGQLTTGRS